MEKGYVEENLPEDIDLQAAVRQLRIQKNAVILAHYYQKPWIQDIADYVGDSLGLAQKASRTDADMIAFAGVYFMAETAKILSPSKKVVLPDQHAGCSLADTCTPSAFRRFVKRHPGHAIITYVNSSAKIKAMSDITCTSTNAKHIIGTIPEERPILFAPDKNLGKYLQKETGRENMTFWPGVCEVHNTFSVEKIERLKKEHPSAPVIAHPECGHLVLEKADFIGSTSNLLHYVKTSSSDTFIVVTEEGIRHEMKKSMPEKKFIAAPPVYYTDCACQECPYMKLNTMKKLYLSLKHEQPAVKLEESVRKRAYTPIKKMLDISAEAGL